jgi:hypothetical protein
MAEKRKPYIRTECLYDQQELPAVLIQDLPCRMKFLDFSPEKELDVVLDHIAKKMAEFSK